MYVFMYMYTCICRFVYLYIHVHTKREILASSVYCYYVYKLGDGEMTRSLPSRHRYPDTGIDIRALAVRGRARYLSVKEAPNNIKSLRISGEETFCFYVTWMPQLSSNPRWPTFQTGSFDHCTRTKPKNTSERNAKSGFFSEMWKSMAIWRRA